MMQQRVVDSWQRIDTIPPDRIMYRIGYSQAQGLSFLLHRLIVQGYEALPLFQQRAYRAAVVLIEPLYQKLQTLIKKPFSKQKSIAINQKMAEGFTLAHEAGFFNNVLLYFQEPIKTYYQGVLYLLYEELAKHYPL